MPSGPEAAWVGGGGVASPSVGKGSTLAAKPWAGSDSDAGSSVGSCLDDRAEDLVLRYCLWNLLAALPAKWSP